MDDLRGIFDRKTIILLFSLLALLMLIGSVWDYPFSQAVYNQQNPFGIFFAAFGEMPAMLGLAASGIMLILGRNKERKLIALSPVELETEKQGYAAIWYRRCVGSSRGTFTCNRGRAFHHRHGNRLQHHLCDTPCSYIFYVFTGKKS